MTKQIEVTTISQYEALMSAGCEGCFARWYGSAQVAFMREVGFKEEPKSPRGCWAACETATARQELEAGRPVQWWPAEWTDAAKRDACHAAAEKAVAC